MSCEKLFYSVGNYFIPRRPFGSVCKRKTTSNIKHDGLS